MQVPVYAVVPSYGRECLRACLNSLIGQVDLLFLIQTRAFPIPPHPKLICLAWDSSRELNISEWWNMGIKAAAMTAAGHRDRERQPEWDVLIANDDIIAPPGLAVGLSRGLRAGPAVLAYCSPGTANATPITGWCFMLRGEAGIRADPRFYWWFGDNDIELQARERGGAVSVPGCQVRHLHPGSHDRHMAPRAAIDAKAFQEKWQQEDA